MGDMAALLKLRPVPYVPDGPDADDDAQSVQEDAAPQPAESRAPAAVALPGGTLSTWEQSAAALRMAIAIARRQWKDRADRDGGVINGLMRAKPPSVAEQEQYLHGKAWVPAGHDGGIAEKSGIVFHALVGIPGVALGNTISGICSRPLRAAIAFLVVYAAALGVLFVLGLGHVAFLLIAALGALAGLWLLAVWLWPDKREPAPDESARAA